jgi:hypothetical protein
VEIATFGRDHRASHWKLTFAGHWSRIISIGHDYSRETIKVHSAFGSTAQAADFKRVFSERASTARRRAEILGSYGRYVKTDIARFYPSIYTHAIPWSIIGKAHAKANHHNATFKAFFASLLDKAVGAGQLGQSIGIPIGPDTSCILSEFIAVEIETIARQHIPDLNDRAVRYVDDILIGLRETETPPAVLSGLSIALYDFELELNAEKTVTHGMGCPHSPEWINYVRTFELNTWPSRQRGDLDSFFEQAFYLTDANPRDNVLLFAVKRAASFNIHKSNLSHLVSWFLYAARRSPSCLSFVAEYLAAMHASAPLPAAEINSYILQQIPVKAEAVHTDEVAWLLFWAREVGLKLPASTLEKVGTLRSSVVALLTLDLRQMGLGRVDSFLSRALRLRCIALKGRLWRFFRNALQYGETA